MRQRERVVVELADAEQGEVAGVHISAAAGVHHASTFPRSYDIVPSATCGMIKHESASDLLTKQDRRRTVPLGFGYAGTTVDYLYSRSVHQGKQSGMWAETLSLNTAGRFSRNAITPSLASAERPRV